MNPSIVEELMERDDVSRSEAEEILSEMRSMLEEGVPPEEILEEFGLELDYLLDLLE